MPTYQYRCTACGHDLEVVQKFSDTALTECPSCHGALRKVFNAVGVVFKGSGFYRTDSRAKEGAAANGSSSEKSEKSDSATPAAANGKESGAKSEGKTSSKDSSTAGTGSTSTSGSSSSSSSSSTGSAGKS